MSGVKRKAAWIACGVVVLIGLVFGGFADRAPRSNPERVQALSDQILCPVCSGETIGQSRTDVASTFRDEVARQVAANRSDAEIRADFQARYGDDIVNVPPSSGLGSLVWVLPVIALIGGGAGLVVAFRRWRVVATPVTDDDRELVEAALRTQRDAPR
jgi:cytochrome c-type biogenesis protein CcmH